MTTSMNRRTVLKGIGAMALGAGMVRLGIRGAGAAGSLVEINSGYSLTPSAACVWRVVADVAPPSGTGEALERAMGFVLANRGDLVIRTLASGSANVPHGSSFFVPEADTESQESASDSATPYIRFGLVVPGDATYTAGGELIFGSEILQFAAGGEARLRLYEGNLSGAERVVLPPTGPHGKVIYAERGSIAVIGVAGDGSESGQRFVLNPGEAVVPSAANNPPDHWEIENVGEVEQPLFYVATAEGTGGGNDASGDPRPDDDIAEQPDGGFGTINAQLVGCSNGVADQSSCNPYGGAGDIELESFETGEVYTEADALAGPLGMRVFNVPFGNYVVRFNVDGFDGAPARVVIDGVTVQNPTIRIDENSPVSSVTIFFSTP